jgi:4'-phosphopantetheinyl transferase EntD
MSLSVLERAASAQLTLPLVVKRSDPDIAMVLTDGELLRLAGVAREGRRRDWLLGRNALKQVLRSLALSDDTSTITFPNRQVSLTHSGKLSFAAGTSAPACGIGIDYEPLRDINRGIARWFLHDEECEWAENSTDHVAAVLRLWTIKEAALKCHPENAGMVLKDFVIVDLNAKVLRVATIGDDPRIQVASHACESGWLSIAVCGDAA